MNARKLFTLCLQGGKQLQPLLLKCFSTPENADGAADRTAAAELVIREMFWSKQPPGLSAGSPSAALSVATLLAPPTAANAEVRRRGARQATAPRGRREVEISGLEVVRRGGTAGFFRDLSVIKVISCLRR